MTWTRYGPDAWLGRFAAASDEAAFRMGRGIAAELARLPPSGLVEYVPAFTTVLLIFHPGTAPACVEALEPISSRLAAAEEAAVPDGPIREIPVIYDGPDLEKVARTHALDPEEVKALHAAPVYRVWVLGFAPGFAYLGGLDPRLHTPRLASPRARVPGGAVAIGGEHTGVYPFEMPGGWNWIGRTRLQLFDPARGREAGSEGGMFLWRPGDRVKFVEE